MKKNENIKQGFAMKKLIIALVLIVAAFIAGFEFGARYDWNPDQGEHYDPVAIEEKIVEISELATFECNYTDSDTYKGDPKKILGFALPLTAKEMMICCSGTVKMGPDIQGNLNVDLDEDAQRLVVTIPHSEILSHEVDEESVKIMYVKNGVFNSVTPQNVNDLRKKMKEREERHIKEETDYLEQADNKAVEQISTFLNTAYPDLEVEVTFNE